MNRPIVGFILGLLLPLVGYVVVYFVLGKGMSFGNYSQSLQHNHKTLSLVLSLSILANLVPFIWYNSKRMDYGARGVFVATMLYAVVIILLKFVW